MQKIINQVLYDSSKATKIVEVSAMVGRLILFKTRNGNFFMLDNNLLFEEIIPQSKQEAQEFLTVHQDKLDPEKFRLILLNEFGISDKTPNPIENAVKIAKFILPTNEQLYFTKPGKEFYLTKDEIPTKINESEALDWVETHQDNISNLEDIIKFYFVTIKRA